MTTAAKEFQPSEQDIKLIREWMLKTPYVVYEKDDGFLRSLITACKGSLQKTKDVYEKINSLGFHHSQMFGHLDPLNEITQYYLNNEYIFPMPKKTEDGSIILIGANRPNAIDLSRFSIFELNRYLFMTLMVYLWEHNAGELKFIVLFDCQNLKLSELKNVTPTYVKDFIHSLRKFPIRLKGIHCINVPNYFQPILNFGKTFLSEKLAERVSIPNSLDELHLKIPKELLPQEFGGHAGDLASLHNSWKKKVENYRHRFISQNRKMRQLDYLRSEQNDNTGLQGSFRKLQLRSMQILKKID